MPDQYIFSALNASSSQSSPPAAVRGGRHGVEPHAVEPHPRADPAGARSATARSTTASRWTTRPGAFWSNPPRVQAAYGKSIVYSLNTLTSFVQHYGNKNLVMIVLGDHQPLPIVSGQKSNHDVPISIIAHDPNVLKQIGSWGWNAGPAAQPERSGVADERLPQPVPRRAFDSHPATSRCVVSAVVAPRDQGRTCGRPPLSRGRRARPRLAAWTASGAWPRCTW